LASRKEQREEARRQREEREAEERKKQRRKRRIWQVGSILAVAAVAIVVVILVAGGGGGGDTTPSEKEGEQTASLFTGVAQSSVTLGNPDAPVTLYEFADLQCPFCRDFSTGSFPQIVDKYVKPGDVKIVFRNLTFLGPDSVTAARAAAAAGAQNKLWDFVDLFYKNQGPENSGYVTDAFIEDLAGQVGLDVEKLQADMSAPLVEQQLGEAQQQAAEFGIDSTPSFLIQIGNEKPKPLDNEGFEFQEMSEKLDAALEEANASSN
jgi:protein-disulfide isomerase